MPSLDDFLQALLRAPRDMTLTIPVGDTSFSLTVGELITVVLSETDTRRAAILAQPPATTWFVHPPGGETNALTFTSAELLHSAPYYHATTPPDEPPPGTVEMEVNTNTLWMHTSPDALESTRKGYLSRGDRIRVNIDTATWKTIAEGVYVGRYVHGDYLKVPNP